MSRLTNSDLLAYTSFLKWRQDEPQQHLFPPCRNCIEVPVCNIFGLFCCTHTNFFIANIVVKMSNLKKTNIILERKTCEKQDSGVRTKLEPVDSFFSPIHNQGLYFTPATITSIHWGVCRGKMTVDKTWIDIDFTSHSSTKHS